LLFNLIVDALGAMLEAAKRMGRIQGVVSHLLDGGLTHLHYAYDKVVMIQDSEENILNLKVILYCFESMSGMKINYHKSEIYVLEGDQQRREVIARQLNCKLGKFPMIYLGVPIHTRKPRK
jgi:hypothetical protein